MGRIGELREVFANERYAAFVWNIDGFSLLKEGQKSSPGVTYFDMEWCLGISNSEKGIDYVRLSGTPLTTSLEDSIHFSVKCKTSDGEMRYIARDQTLPENCEFSELLVHSPIRIHICSNVKLTCSLRKVVSSHAPGGFRDTLAEGAFCSNDEIEEHLDPGSKAISTLLEHFKKMLCSGDGHDVLLKVGDEQFRAHKHILQARSPVFAAMFSSGMEESVKDSVTIEDCDPESFGKFLQFVYSGKADIASVGNALGLYYAGDKYDFPNLKKMCVEFLKRSFTTTTVFDVISLAARHEEEELFQQAEVYFANNLEAVMLTVEWQRFLMANPIQANEMNLRALRCLKSFLCQALRVN